MLKIKKITKKLGSIVEYNKDIEALVGWPAEEILKKQVLKKDIFQIKMKIL